jgi:hypothetical protein
VRNILSGLHLIIHCRGLNLFSINKTLRKKENKKKKKKRTWTLSNIAFLSSLSVKKLPDGQQWQYSV